jgi:hypothetical protein
MNFAHTWYLIERNHHLETISHEAMLQLPEGSFSMLQNFETHHEAQEEQKRMVRLAIDEMKKKLGN